MGWALRFCRISVTAVNRSKLALTGAGYYAAVDTREKRLRYLAYVGLAVMAIAVVVIVVHLSGTPGWHGHVKVKSYR